MKNKTNNGNEAKEKIIRTALKHLDTVKINPTNKKTISNFIDQLSAEGLTKDRQSKYIYTTVNISRGVKNKDFSKLTKKDIITFIGNINNSDFSEWTKRDYRILLRRLMKYVREQEGQTFKKGEYPSEVEWLSSSMKKSRKRLPKDLLTIDDVKELSQGMLNLRDKAFCLFLYESGARIGEILNLKIKDFNTDTGDKRYTKVTLFGKTGERVIPIIASAPAISNWIKHHPIHNDRDAWLFCSLNRSSIGRQSGYFYMNKLLKVAAKRIGLKKPVNPHHFRHSRSTELAKKLTEAQLCKYMGWEIGSKEAATYVHLSGRDMDNVILSIHGLAELETEAETFTPIECPRCGISNEPGAKYCSGCALGLDEKSIMEYDQQKEQATKLGFASKDMLKDPEFREFYNEMLLNTIEKYKEMKEKSN